MDATKEESYSATSPHGTSTDVFVEYNQFRADKLVGKAEAGGELGAPNSEPFKSVSDGCQGHVGCHSFFLKGDNKRNDS